MANQEQQQFTIQRIYLKDVSFEIPNAPNIFREEWKPENNLTISTTINGLEQNTFEVVLSVNLISKAGEKTIFVIELQQAGIFTITGMLENERLRLLGAYCPNVLFAYAREIVTDLVIKGSFQQVILQPINFDALFLQHQQELAKRAQDESSRGQILN
jgi:preprotein translocase subunit SecB